MTKKKPVRKRAKNVTKKVTKESFDRVAAALRTRLLGLQDQLKSEDFSVAILFAGAAVAGKNESLNLITEWMDPRWIITHAYGPPSEEERQRPPYWRYWRDLPPRGQIGLFAGSWYHQPVHDFATGEIGKHKFFAALDKIRTFEKVLADDGTLILKFWLRMDKEALKKRIKSLEKDKRNAWRVGELDWKHMKQHNKLEKAHQLTADYTDAEDRHWIEVDGADPRARSLHILTTIRDSLAAHIKKRQSRRARVSKAREEASKKRQDQLIDIQANLDTLEKQSQDAARKSEKASAVKPAGRGLVLDRLDMSLHLEDEDYERSVKELRGELGTLCRRLHFEGKSALILFEGPDAAGKGGAIRRLTASMDARDYRVIQVAAPSEEERAQHYLWRFWRHLPQAGRLTIYDRTWYGRVLVERVEGFAQPEEWMRGYEEINDFERQLSANHLILVKFWIHITKDEQYRRFKERETISYKKWKLTAEDWRNREKWDDYAVAVDEMVTKTSTEHAPWTLVEGNDKKFARIKVMETVCNALKRGLKDEK